MASHGAFVHMSARRQSVLLSVCQQCGRFIAASPNGGNLKAAEAVHHCDLTQRKPPATADEDGEPRSQRFRQ